jgi:rifampicin phosphotransferase
MQTESAFILPLSEPSAGLAQVGGKGASLAHLAAAGLPVPPGFCVTTAAYRRFVAEHGLQEQILAAVCAATPEQPATLEEASGRIGELFAQHTMPDDVAEAIRRAYGALEGGDAPVAVRSSATAEDLPGASFAGQQETYLNIRGAEAVLAAAQKCWASLWTARAIAYRARQGIAPDSVALAVVIQKLVFADAAGVMFTANPLTGSRDEIVINATWGLGEALVSGAVTPDTLTVEKATGKVIRRETAEKQVMTVRMESGTGEASVPDSQKREVVLTDAQAAELAKLGADIEKLYEASVDIEWTLAAGRFAVVQARPITTLRAALPPERPLEWNTPYPAPLLAHGSSIDLLPDVLSPLFLTLAMPILTRVFDRMYAEVMGLHREDTPIFEVIHGYVFLCFPKRGKFWKYMRVHAATAGKLYEYGRAQAEEVRARCHEVVTGWRHRDLAAVTAPELLDGARELFEGAAGFLNVAVDRPIPQSNFSELFFGLFYNALVRRKGDPAAASFLLGLENLPLAAEKSVFDLAQWVGAQPELADHLAHTPSEQIWVDLHSTPLPAPLSGEFAARCAAHLEAYGHILYDVDFMVPLPAEEPVLLLDTLKAYLSGQSGNPRFRQETQERKRQQAQQAISQRLDPLRRKWFRKLLASAQECAVERENAIADIGRPYPQLRRLVAELGWRLAASGAITRPEDIYWLEAPEVDALAVALEAHERLSSHSTSVEARKASWQRARRATPPTVLPETHLLARMYAPKKPRANLLRGKGTSPGQVTAPACVLRGPEDFGQMRPGDVLVAVATTPAWTPLFALASAVVTDIGGPLSHSSIVAREYAIPAVMATGLATRRICTGQVITVDGDNGTVALRD